MVVLRRILKYTPAVVLGLLLAMWIGLAFIAVDYSRRLFVIGGDSSTVGFVFASDEQIIYGERGWRFEIRPFHFRKLLGRLSGEILSPQGAVVVSFSLPVPLLVTLWLPIAIGSLNSFRYRLWHYLAYTALVAVELAYYVRWQG